MTPPPSEVILDNLTGLRDAYIRLRRVQGPDEALDEALDVVLGPSAANCQRFLSGAPSDAPSGEDGPAFRRALLEELEAYRGWSGGAEAAQEPEPNPVAPPDDAPPLGPVIARVVALFAFVGVGLGVGTLLFLWSTGVFDPSSSIEDLGRAFLGVIAIGAVLVFAILIGVVLAVVSGMIAAANAPTGRDAAVAGAMGAGVGHVVLIVTLGAVLLAGFAIATDPSPRTSSTPDPECLAFFDDPDLCGPDEPSEDNATDISIGDLAKLVLGVIPAGLVGGASASVLHPTARRGRSR